ncbi:metallophosphoesterase [Butyrivibrio sp. YAB3001]|uniref:metallophosphoesterase n=1 Tax=Butyrivibrio sp. YAB3001 TaxID=1520812 RepID=UPI0015880149|nr:metallophosphoesterase [Butyrivibrio sp. YAB3001]
MIFFIIFVAACALIIYHDVHCFVVRSYDIETDKIVGDYSFAFLSDLHGYSFGKDNSKLLDEIYKISPDAVLCAGDMLTGHKIGGEIQYQTGLKLLSALATRYPVYMSNGNHEHKIKDYKRCFGDVYDVYKQKLIDSGIIFLENDSFSIDSKNIRITGLDLELDYFQKVIKKEMNYEHVKELVGDSSPDEFQILIAHNPQYFDNYAKWGANLTVSGHVHGGIVRIPFLGGVISPSIALFPKYDGGKFEIDGKYMVLSRGLGTHSIHVRMFNPCELDIIRIHGKEN